DKGKNIIALRVRPSRQPPPELAFPHTQKFASHRRLPPNLFLPCGMQLQPPLRRDIVRQLLADNPDNITWLCPEAEGSFTPQSLPDGAFRQLSDWVEYVLDAEHVALQAWMQSTRFDFESFICANDRPDRPRKSEEKESRPDTKRARQPGEKAADTPP